MDGIAAQLLAQSVVPTGKAYGWPISNFEGAPLIYVDYPAPGGITFDATFKRGTDDATFPVYFVCGKVADKAARDALSAIVDGATGIKAGLEAGASTLTGVVSSVHVKDFNIEKDHKDSAGESWLCARFDVQVLT